MFQTTYSCDSGAGDDDGQCKVDDRLGEQPKRKKKSKAEETLPKKGKRSCSHSGVGARVTLSDFEYVNLLRFFNHYTFENMNLPRVVPIFLIAITYLHSGIDIRSFRRLAAH